MGRVAPIQVCLSKTKKNKKKWRGGALFSEKNYRYVYIKVKISKNIKLIGKNGEDCWWRVCYQWGYPV